MKKIILCLLGHLARGVGAELIDPVAVSLVLINDRPEPERFMTNIFHSMTDLAKFL